MATYIKGNAVANATSYTLYEKVGTAYNELKTENEINFNVSDLITTEGDHTLVVKAKASGYTDSEYSNEVVYNMTASGGSSGGNTDGGNTGGGDTGGDTGGDSGGDTGGDTGGTATNLYSAASNPVKRWYVGNTWTIDSTNTKRILAPATTVATANPVFVEHIPVQSGKTYSFKVYNAPETVKKADGTDISYYGICGLFFYETIDGKPSIKYAHSFTGSFTEHVSYWNTSKYPSYTGAIPISETNNASVFATSQNYDPTTKIEVTNLTSGAKNDATRTCVFKGAANYSKSGQVKIVDSSITHMSIVFGNPADANYLSGGVPADFATAMKVIEDGLVIIEGTNLPSSI